MVFMADGFVMSRLEISNRNQIEKGHHNSTPGTLLVQMVPFFKVVPCQFMQLAYHLEQEPALPH